MRSALNTILLGLCAVTAFASADPSRLIFTKDFPGSVPAHVWILVEPSGAAQYRESDDDNPEKLQVEPDLLATMFDLAAKLDHFKNPLESGLKVANMGAKTFRWEEGESKTSQTFNYSLDENARKLQDWFECIADSARMIIGLRRAMRHDRLGVHQALIEIEAAYFSKRLVGTVQFLPLFDRVAGDDQYLHMARARAGRLGEAIRGGKPRPE
jgi:hypothetical protein